MSNVETTKAAKEGKFLTFFLQGEEYGVDVLKVREIIKMIDITPIPQTPPFVKGVINLRGVVIPVISLKRKFGMDETGGDAQESCIIVTEVRMDKDKKASMGIVIDKVSEVLDIEGKDVEPAPEFGSRVKTEFILGIAKKATRVKILLDIDAVLTSEEMVLVGPADKPRE